MSLERLFARRTAGIHLELAAIEAVHRSLGRPAADLPAVHVVGTNGKGSVAAMIEHALRSRGHRVGLYTSPHLLRVTERVRIDGRQVDEDALEAAVEAVLSLEAETPLARPLSFFEILTLAALVCFDRAGLDLIVVEAGLGGRLDATRLVSAHVVAITSIDLDHQAFLGDDLSSIAAEKAAVLRSGVPCISAPQAPAALRVVTEYAHRVGAPLHVVEPLPRAPRGLPGEHQRINGAVALHAARVLEPALSPDDLDGVAWPGRLEWIPRGRGGVLLDAAHNPGGVEALVRFVQSDDAPDLRSAIVVFGCAPDKERTAMLAPLGRLGLPLWWVPPTDATSAVAPPEAIRAFEGPDDPHLLAALERWLAQAPAIVCGSHLLVGPLRERLLGRAATPDPSDPRP